jgi:hypothetical protein
MATTTVAHKAFYAQLHGLAGVITKPADHVLFLEPESGAVITLTAADSPHVVVLGEVATSMQAYIADMAIGRSAIVCSRRMEVQ